MPGPFVGMDPFLEAPAIWLDFHHELASAIRQELLPLLPRHYYVKVLHRKVTEHLTSQELGVVMPDASVVQHRPPSLSPLPPTSVCTSAAVEVELELAIESPQFYVEVTRIPEERLVTAIEIISPSNKRPGSRDRLRYLRTRDMYLAGDAHFIEVDLLRGGERWPAGTAPESAYRVLLSRAGRRPRAQVWTISLRDPLPAVPVPLAGEDPDIALSLANALNRAYDNADYGRYLRYDGPVPGPSLSKDDLVWVQVRLGGSAPCDR